MAGYPGYWNDGVYAPPMGSAAAEPESMIRVIDSLQVPRRWTEHDRANTSEQRESAIKRGGLINTRPQTVQVEVGSEDDMLRWMRVADTGRYKYRYGFQSTDENGETGAVRVVRPKSRPKARRASAKSSQDEYELDPTVQRLFRATGRARIDIGRHTHIVFRLKEDRR